MINIGALFELMLIDVVRCCISNTFFSWRASDDI